MEVPTSDALLQQPISSEPLKKSVPRPFSIEALMSDCGPKKETNIGSFQWGLSPPQNYHHSGRDTDSDGSVDMDLAQDLSRRSQKDAGEFSILLVLKEFFLQKSYPARDETDCCCFGRSERNLFGP